MKKQQHTEKPSDKKKLVLRKESIRALDDADLSFAGGLLPPDGGVPPPTT